MNATTPPRELPIFIRGLTVYQPWAWAIAAGHKDIENRSWPPPSSMVGGWLAVHAGKHVDRGEWGDVLGKLRLPGSITLAQLESQCGSILAVARVTGFVRSSASPWFLGPVGWTLADVVALPVPVPCRGAQGLWALPVDVAAKVLAGWAQARPGATLGGLAR